LEGSRAILVVSQFTLFGDARKGRRPSFIEACEPVEASRLYRLFCDQLRGLGLKVQTGEFAAHMRVALVNDGPVTLILDSPEGEKRLLDPGILGGNQLVNLGRAGRRQNRLAKLRILEQPGDASERLEMDARRVLGSQEREEKVRRLAVNRVEINARMG